MTSFKVNFNFPKFQGGSNICYPGGGGGGVKLFLQWGGVQLLSDRTYDLYWTPVPDLDPCNFHEFNSTTANLSLASAQSDQRICFSLFLKYHI